MFTPFFLSTRAQSQLPSPSHILPQVLAVPTLAIAILLGPAPAMDPRSMQATGPSCKERLAEADAALEVRVPGEAPVSAAP